MIKTNPELFEWILFNNTVYKFIGKVQSETPEDYILTEYYTIVNNKISHSPEARRMLDMKDTIGIDKNFVNRTLGKYTDIDAVKDACVELFV